MVCVLHTRAFWYWFSSIWHLTFQCLKVPQSHNANEADFKMFCEGATTHMLQFAFKYMLITCLVSKTNWILHELRVCMHYFTGKVLLYDSNVTLWCKVVLLFIFFFPTISGGEGYSEILFATSPVMHSVRPTFYKGIVFCFLSLSLQ